MNPNKRTTWDLKDAQAHTKQHSNKGARKTVVLLKRKLKKRAARHELALALKEDLG